MAVRPEQVNKSTGIRSTISAVIVAIGAFLLRTLGQLDKVFVLGTVQFREADPWYHIRLTENMLSNFPWPLKYDPFVLYPEGGEVSYFPLMDWVTVLISKLGINYEYIAAFIPPIAGALSAFLVYLLGKKLFSPRVGIFASILFATIPAESFHRSLLGFYDNHAIEILLVLLIIYLLVVHISKNRPLTWWIVPTGIALGLYNLNWHGVSFFYIILLGWYIVEFVLGVLKNKTTLNSSLVLSLASFISLIPSFWVIIGKDAALETIVAIVACVVIPLLFELIKSKTQGKTALYICAPILVVGYIVADLLYPGNLAMVTLGYVFWGYGTFIQETRPLTLSLYFAIYGITAFLSILGVISYTRDKKVSTLLLVISAVFLLAAIGQRKWTYYYTPFLSLMAANFAMDTLPKWFHKDTRPVLVTLLLIFTLASYGVNTIRLVNIPNNITPFWYESLIWLRHNSPEPMKEDFNSLNFTSKASYGVLTWWDYGHWVIYIAHRAPLDSPTVFSALPARFLIAQTEAEALKILEDNNLNIGYVIITREMVNEKWYAITERAGYDIDLFREYLPNSEAMRIWEGKSEVFKLAYTEGEIRIFGNTKGRLPQE